MNHRIHYYEFDVRNKTGACNYDGFVANFFRTSIFVPMKTVAAPA
jgi:hypothetical protein